MLDVAAAVFCFAVSTDSLICWVASSTEMSTPGASVLRSGWGGIGARLARGDGRRQHQFTVAIAEAGNSLHSQLDLMWSWSQVMLPFIGHEDKGILRRMQKNMVALTPTIFSDLIPQTFTD